MNVKFWYDLKKYYENDYDGKVADKTGEKYAKEMSQGGATFITGGNAYSPFEVDEWIKDTLKYLDEADGDEIEETESLFPNIHDYEYYYDHIASYFLHQFLKEFGDAMVIGEDKYAKVAVELKWTEMIMKNDALALFTF